MKDTTKIVLKKVFSWFMQNYAEMVTGQDRYKSVVL